MTIYENRPSTRNQDRLDVAAAVVAPHVTSPPADRTWRFGTGMRVMLGFAAVFMFAVAALLFSLPLIVGGSDPAANGIIAVTGIIMTGFGLFMTFGLIGVVRTQIGIQGPNLEATVPQHHNLLLVPRFRVIEVPLAHIRAVETRQEAFRSFGLVNLRNSLSIVTSDGERIGLFSNTLGPAAQLPLDEIAGAIASGAGVAVTDAGTVWTKAPGLYGEASSSWREQPLDQAGAIKVRRAAVLTAQIAGTLLLLVLALRACS